MLEIRFGGQLGDFVSRKLAAQKTPEQLAKLEARTLEP
jgi:hypothetical protein